MGVLESRRKVDFDNESLHKERKDVMFSSVLEGEGVPTWANILLKAIAWVGVPSVIAMFLVYQNSLWGPRLEALGKDTQTDIKQVREIQDKELAKQDQIYRLLQRICSNTAKTSEERQKCFDN